jgi:putative N6-adenine-specific DNA methylase
MARLRLFAACAPGVEPLLADEVAALGAKPNVVPGGVELDGDLKLAARANVELGLALFVLVRIGELRATKLPELVRKVAAIDFRSFVTRGQPVALRVRAKASRLYHTGAIAERVRAGMAESLGEVPPEVVVDEKSDEKSDEVAAFEAATIHVRFDHDVCTISLDSSGMQLHKRGWRQASAKAPLREDLARALLVLSGWDRRSVLIDPLMGSGTLPIEAAILARKLPPGGARRFALENVPGAKILVEEAKREAKARALGSLPAPIFGSDRDAGALRAATANSERAGVAADLKLACAAMSNAPWDEAAKSGHGALVTNPPWGVRIGDAGDLRALYQAIGNAARRLPSSWHVAIATANRALGSATGLPLTSALVTDAGGTKVHFLVSTRRGPEPRSP